MDMGRPDPLFTREGIESRPAPASAAEFSARQTQPADRNSRSAKFVLGISTDIFRTAALPDCGLQEGARHVGIWALASHHPDLADRDHALWRDAGRRARGLAAARRPNAARPAEARRKGPQ